MQRASTLENSSFNVVLLKYLWRMIAVQPSNNTCSDHRRVDSLSTEDTTVTDTQLEPSVLALWDLE